jgi:hypothetical protein
MRTRPLLNAAGLAAALVVLGPTDFRAEPLPLPDLQSHRWKHRVLLIDTPATTAAEYQTQAAALLTAWAGLIERDLHLVTRANAAAFRIRLIGKDGGEKLDSSAPVSAEALFALIDAMPMRRAEMVAPK